MVVGDSHKASLSLSQAPLRGVGDEGEAASVEAGDKGGMAVNAVGTPEW